MVRELILITHIEVDNGFQIYRTIQNIIDCDSTIVCTTSVTTDIFIQPTPAIYNTKVTYFTNFKHTSTLCVNHMIFIGSRNFTVFYIIVR